MRRKDGRIEPGQSLRGAISARAWNRAQDAADVVLGGRPGFASDGVQGIRGPYDVVRYRFRYPIGTDEQNKDRVLKVHHVDALPSFVSTKPAEDDAEIWQEYPVFELPSRTAHQHRVVVAIEPIRHNSVGSVAISGVWPVKLRLRAHQDQYAMLHTERVLKTSTNQLVERFNSDDLCGDWRLQSFPFAGFRIVWHPKQLEDTYPANCIGLVDLSQFHAQPVVLAKWLPSRLVAELYIDPFSATGLYVRPEYDPVIPEASNNANGDWLWLFNPFCGPQGGSTSQYFGQTTEFLTNRWRIVGTQLSPAQLVNVSINGTTYKVFPGSSTVPSTVLLPGSF